VIVDCHTHIFPPEVAAERDRYLAADPAFRALYGSPKAHLATAGDLLASMAEAGIDISVALGSAWTALEDCRRHNDYLIESAAASGGRIVPFCTLPLAAGPDAVAAEAARCLDAGVRGFGELRPDNLGFDLAGEAGDALAEAVAGATLLFHVSEPVGHAYPGKEGLRIETFAAFVAKHPELRVIGAHWGGGLPFYTLMPEVRLGTANVLFDTAGTSLLYTPAVYRRGVDAAGAEHVVFGSDFPLQRQARSRRRIEESSLTPDELVLVLGDNAARLLALE
jgi:predicted TIM-barrel fold metal-dependent hydrolase